MKAQQQSAETRQAQLYMGMYQQMMNPQISEAERILEDAKFANFEEYSRLLKDKEFAKAYNAYSYWLEGIGVLVRENLIDVRLPALLFSGGILWYWEKFGPMIVTSRKEWNWPRVMIETEYLAHRVKEYAGLHPELGIRVPITLAG